MIGMQHRTAKEACHSERGGVTVIFWTCTQKPFVDLGDAWHTGQSILHVVSPQRAVDDLLQEQKAEKFDTQPLAACSRA